jgi:hypothetical protein
MFSDLMWNVFLMMLQLEPNVDDSGEAAVLDAIGRGFNTALKHLSLKVIMRLFLYRQYISSTTGPSLFMCHLYWSTITR